MPKRYENWSAAKIHITPEHRAAILKRLPLSDPSSADAVIAEIEEILGLLHTNRTRLPEVREATDQLVALSEAAVQMHRALEELGRTARAVMSQNVAKADMDHRTAGPDAISGLNYLYSTWAAASAEEIRPGTGRRSAWPEMHAVFELAKLWEARTGNKAAWLNRENDGGPFCRFAEAVSQDISSRQIQKVLQLRMRNERK